MQIRLATNLEVRTAGKVFSTSAMDSSFFTLRWSPLLIDELCVTVVGVRIHFSVGEANQEKSRSERL